MLLDNEEVFHLIIKMSFVYLPEEMVIFYSSKFFEEDGSLKEVHKINEMYASLQEELKVS